MIHVKLLEIRRANFANNFSEDYKRLRFATNLSTESYKFLLTKDFVQCPTIIFHPKRFIVPYIFAFINSQTLKRDQVPLRSTF